MTIQRKNPKINKGMQRRPRFAIAIDQRSGFKGLQKDMVFEPGTGYYVNKKESDGKRNLITDPLNFPSEKLKYAEALSLRHPSPEVALHTPVELSANEFGLPSHASITNQFIEYANIYSTASIGTGTSSSSGSTNGTQYYIIYH